MGLARRLGRAGEAAAGTEAVPGPLPCPTGWAVRAPVPRGGPSECACGGTRSSRQGPLRAAREESPRAALGAENSPVRPGVPTAAPRGSRLVAEAG